MDRIWIRVGVNVEFMVKVNLKVRFRFGVSTIVRYGVRVRVRFVFIIKVSVRFSSEARPYKLGWHFMLDSG